MVGVKRHPNEFQRFWTFQQTLQASSKKLLVLYSLVLTLKNISARCFAVGLHNRYLEDTLHCLFMLSQVTRYHSLTHIKSDIRVLKQCSHHVL